MAPWVQIAIRFSRECKLKLIIITFKFSLNHAFKKEHLKQNKM